jgi:hypothetical protein
MVRDYLNEQKGRWVTIREVKHATGLPVGSIQKTDAWRAQMEQRRKTPRSVKTCTVRSGLETLASTGNSGGPNELMEELTKRYLEKAKPAQRDKYLGLPPDGQQEVVVEHFQGLVEDMRTRCRRMGSAAVKALDEILDEVHTKDDLERVFLYRDQLLDDDPEQPLSDRSERLQDTKLQKFRERSRPL